MLEFLQRFFGKEAEKPSKTIAKERLRLVLMHDRLDISPEIMEALRADILRVISDYCEIDQSAMEIGLHRGQGSVALVANIPVLRLKRLPAHN
ncbi:MAG: cell division topological specificity factor MinE [Thermacetogeniaceae bacterium]